MEHAACLARRRLLQLSDVLVQLLQRLNDVNKDSNYYSENLHCNHENETHQSPVKSIYKILVIHGTNL